MAALQRLKLDLGAEPEERVEKLSEAVFWAMVLEWFYNLIF